MLLSVLVPRKMSLIDAVMSFVDALVMQGYDDECVGWVVMMRIEVGVWGRRCDESDMYEDRDEGQRGDCEDS